MSRPGRTRKSGSREPSGRPQRNWANDYGSQFTWPDGQTTGGILEQRADVIRGADPRDYRAGTPLGILCLRKDIDEDEYRAGICYERTHQSFWGGMPGRPSPNPRSHLGQFVASGSSIVDELASLDEATRKARCMRLLTECKERIERFGEYPRRILERVCISHGGLRFMDGSKSPVARERDARDLAALKLALGVLMDIYGIRRRHEPLAHAAQ